MNSPLLFTLVLVFIYQADAIFPVISIDFGNEFLKVAIVKPGIPMEILLNRESHRKTPAAVSLNNGERYFGESAMAQYVKRPSCVFMFLRDLLGKEVTHPSVQAYKRYFPYHSIEAHPEKRTVVFVHEGKKYGVEELVAMILQDVKQMAESYSGQTVRHVVLTVPPFWTQAERAALKRAAELVDLAVLQLIGSNAAIALQRGVFRRKEITTSPEYFLLFDMGSSYTTASIISYQKVKLQVDDIVEEVPQMAVKAVGYSGFLGGFEMQLRVRDELAKMFNEGNFVDADITKDARAMAKLLKEAGRLMKILSANKEATAQVENLFMDKDFKAKFSREIFEQLNVDLFSAVVVPVKDALNMSGITLGEIREVLLFGAGTRIPKVQQELLKATGKSSLGKSLNTDEAAALGAVYQGAYISKAFRVMRFAVKEAVLHPVVIEFERQGRDENGEVTNENLGKVRKTLCSAGSSFPVKKILSFSKRLGDFEFNVTYGEALSDGWVQRPTIASVRVTGVSQSLASHQDDTFKGVKAFFTIDENGLLFVSSVESLHEKNTTEDETLSAFASLTGKLSNLFGGSDDRTADGTEGEKGTTECTNCTSKEKESVNASKSENVTIAANATEDSKPKKPLQVKDILEIDIIRRDLPDPSSEELKKSSDLLEELLRADRIRLERAQALNDLESYVILAQERMYIPEYENAITEEDAGKLRSDLSGVSDWIYDQPTDVGKELLATKLVEVKKLTQAWFRRADEAMQRPTAFESLRKAVNETKVFMTTLQKLMKNMTDTDSEAPISAVDMKSLEKIITETSVWRKERMAELSGIKLTDEVSMRVEDIAVKERDLKREMSYLLTKIKLHRPKPKPTVSETNKTTTTKANDSVTDEGNSKGQSGSTTEDPSTDDRTFASEAETEKTTTGATPRADL